MTAVWSPRAASRRRRSASSGRSRWTRRLLDDIGYCEWCTSVFAYTKVANARDQAGARALWPEVSAGRDLYADRHLIRNLDAHTCERVRGRAA